jgi:DNA-binding response OmpR family regulator
MKTHFPTVPVQVALQKAKLDENSHIPLVLVADGEALIVETLQAVLNMRGLATAPAFNGKQALEMARLAPPDILIADVALPGMDGFDLALEFSKIAPNCDIILISGEPSSCSRAAEYRAQGCDFVLMMRPVHPQDLLACVFELLSLRGWLVAEPVPFRETNLADVILFDSLSARRRRSHRPELQKSAWAQGKDPAPESAGAGN